jgi:flagellar biosynthetic protein FliO
VASLVLVIGLLGGVLWWLRRLAPRAGAGRYIRVVESVPLGQAQSLHLVRVADRGLLVASSRDRCELVCELESIPSDLLPAGRP